MNMLIFLNFCKYISFINLPIYIFPDKELTAL